MALGRTYDKTDGHSPEEYKFQDEGKGTRVAQRKDGT
jgi:hypothetical protein